jgi:inorganic pyrophosphatase
MNKDKLFSQFRPHPWHGLSAGKNPPLIVNAYIEITPFDLIKYEIDKASGYLRVDRPQRGSSNPPTLYGFVPQTYCGEAVQKLSPKSLCGDGDALDICVFSERPITKSEIILSARVIGGIQMIDNNEADDKIIAVLESDDIWGTAHTISDIPKALVDRLWHYFSTYKLVAGKESSISIEKIYDVDHAMNVINAARQDYDAHWPTYVCD